MAPSKITIRERIKAIHERGMNGDKAVCKKYRVSLRTLRRWAKNKDVYISEASKKGNKMTLHNGRPMERVAETAHLIAVVDDMILTGKGNNCP
jgi:hypothetical protein